MRVAPILHANYTSSHTKVRGRDLQNQPKNNPAFGQVVIPDEFYEELDHSSALNYKEKNKIREFIEHSKKVGYSENTVETMGYSDPNPAAPNEILRKGGFYFSSIKKGGSPESDKDVYFHYFIDDDIKDPDCDPKELAKTLKHYQSQVAFDKYLESTREDSRRYVDFDDEPPEPWENPDPMGDWIDWFPM